MVCEWVKDHFADFTPFKPVGPFAIAQYSSSILRRSSGCSLNGARPQFMQDSRLAVAQLR